MAKWNAYDLEFRRRAVEQMKTCDDVTALAGELKVGRTTLYDWKRQFAGRPRPRRLDLSSIQQSEAERKLLAENRLLKEALGQKTLEADFFAGALRRIEERRRNSSSSGETASMPRSGRGRKRRKAN
jgi:transposase-like protein